MLVAPEVADLTTLEVPWGYWTPPLPGRVELARAPYLEPGDAGYLARSTECLRPTLPRFELLRGVR